MTGLEPVTSSLRTKRSTGLSYTPEGRSGYQSPRAVLPERDGVAVTTVVVVGFRSRVHWNTLPGLCSIAHLSNH